MGQLVPAGRGKLSSATPPALFYRIITRFCSDLNSQNRGLAISTGTSPPIADYQPFMAKSVGF